MIQIFKDSYSLSAGAAKLFVETAREAVRDRGKFTVALTGGASPQQLYELLASKPYQDEIPWDNTFLFWGDERWVSLTDERSNYKMAKESLLSKVPVREEQIFPMWKEQEPEAFAQLYEVEIRKTLDNDPPRFDLILLGMGDDGHTASLFPATSVLEEKERLVIAYYLQQQDMYRITLTAACINKARKILFITFGPRKASALYEVLEGERNPEQYPAQLIQPEKGEVFWLVDEAAAHRLSAQL